MKKATIPSRRTFLLSAGVAGAAVAGAGVVRISPRTRPAENASPHATRGYHASEHINNYYRTTRV